MNELFYHFGVAIGIGFLIGLERESRKSEQSYQFLFGGIRTFPLLALAGFLAAMLGDVTNSSLGLIIPVLIAGTFLVTAYLGSVKNGDYGMTTEVIGLLIIIIGALCYYGQLEIAAASGIAMLLLLSLKMELHNVGKIVTKTEMISIAKFGLMTVIILPMLPNEPVLPAPFDVLILRNIWLMVVLVTGIGMVGYFLKKLIGNSKAIVLTGFIGGLVSSTAVSLTFSAKSKDRPDLAKLFAMAVIVAWITMFIRVLVEVAVVNPALLKGLWIPMFSAALAGALYCLVLRKKNVKTEEDSSKEDMTNERPFSLKKSVIFGLVYAAVLVIANIAQQQFGDGGIYISAIAAGFTDVDAVTLSMAEMSRASGSVAPDVAIKAITLAAVSNTLVKSGIVLTSAHKALKKEILPGVIVIVLAAIVTAFFI